MQQEALANELCGKIWLERGQPDAARPFLTGAYRCYGLWGARAKLAHLDERYGDLLPTPRPLAILESAPDMAGSVDAGVLVDMSTVLKVAQAVAVEIEVGGCSRN